MYKTLLALSFLLSGCANFTIGGTMCDQLEREPGNVLPAECRNYNEKEATEAFEKVVDQKKISDKDIEFVPEEDK